MVQSRGGDEGGASGSIKGVGGDEGGASGSIKGGGGEMKEGQVVQSNWPGSHCTHSIFTG